MEDTSSQYLPIHISRKALALMFEISGDVPVPPKRGGGGVPKYPFARMTPGDSFAIPAPSHLELSKAAERANWAVVSYRRKHNPSARFAVRRLDDHVRVWRVS